MWADVDMLNPILGQVWVHINLLSSFLKPRPNFGNLELDDIGREPNRGCEWTQSNFI